ncbi:MAG: septum formation initiator family protein [Anaerolineaceae bacterium]|nr:septum formation initiator family protein [Anaerolineaceae bacterium]
MKKLSLKNLGERIRKVKLSDRRIIIVVVILLVIFLMMDFNNRMVLLLRLNNERDTLSTRVAALEQTKASFDQRIIYATSEVALEEWAREEARMIEEGDIPIIVIPPVGEAPSSTPLVVKTPNPIARWQIWQELFFGED